MDHHDHRDAADPPATPATHSSTTTTITAATPVIHAAPIPAYAVAASPALARVASGTHLAALGLAPAPSSTSSNHWLAAAAAAAVAQGRVPSPLSLSLPAWTDPVTSFARNSPRLRAAPDTPLLAPNAYDTPTFTNHLHPSDYAHSPIILPQWAGLGTSGLLPTAGAVAPHLARGGEVVRMPRADDAASGPQLVVVMVGLPARGKSYICKKLQRYLTWLGFPTRVFNVGNRRRTAASAAASAAASVASTPLVEHAPRRDSFPIGPPPSDPFPDAPIRVAGAGATSAFFDPDNAAARAARDQLALDTVDELLEWLHDGKAKVAIHDATNTTLARRKLLMAKLRPHMRHVHVLFLESICDDPAVIDANVRMKLRSPDYAGMDPDLAIADFMRRMRNYERAYEPLGEYEESKRYAFIQVKNVGQKVVTSHIRGYLSSQIVFYLMNIHIADRTIWLTRHGESAFNVDGRIGGDAPLTERGRKYAHALARFFDSLYGGDKPKRHAQVPDGPIRRVAPYAPPVPVQAPPAMITRFSVPGSPALAAVGVAEPGFASPSSILGRRRGSIGSAATVGAAPRLMRVATAAAIVNVPSAVGTAPTSPLASPPGFPTAVEGVGGELDETEVPVPGDEMEHAPSSDQTTEGEAVGEGGEEDEEPVDDDDDDDEDDDAAYDDDPVLLGDLSLTDDNHPTSCSPKPRRKRVPRVPVWTSTLRRTLETAEPLAHSRFAVKPSRLLTEIHSGSFECMTPAEIERMWPGEVARRAANKLAYRYPGLGGESYLDVVARLKPMIIEMERITHDIVVVTHNVVARIMLAYYLGVPLADAPKLEVPLHDLYALRPRPYGTEVVRFRYDEERDEMVRVPDEDEGRASSAPGRA